MKFLHMADLHLGKRVNGFSMLSDQKYILEQTLKCVRQEKPDALLLAGDIYDKGVPPAEAVQLFDWFLTELVSLSVSVFFISGNHDSGERLSFGTALLQKEGVYGAAVFHGTPQPVYLEDEFGQIAVYLLPFFKPAQAAAWVNTQSDCIDEKESDCLTTGRIETCQQAYETVIRNMKIDTSVRNILVTHGFVINAGSPEGMPEECDSEFNSIGGLDAVDASLFADFDYVALGHLHGPQKIGREYVRYAGSPLKYSFSETFQNKGLTFVNLLEKGTVEIYRQPLTPLHDLRVLKGPLEKLLSPEVYSLGDTEDYVEVILTDRDDILDAINKIRRIYPNVMQLEFEKESETEQTLIKNPEPLDEKSLKELFISFYEEQNHCSPSEEQTAYILRFLEENGGEWL